MTHSDGKFLDDGDVRSEEKREKIIPYIISVTGGERHVEGKEKWGVWSF